MHPVLLLSEASGEGWLPVVALTHRPLPGTPSMPAIKYGIPPWEKDGKDHQVIMIRQMVYWSDLSEMSKKLPVDVDKQEKDQDVVQTASGMFRT